MAFCVRLLLLSVLFLKFIHVVACISTVFMKDWIIFHCIDKSHFVTRSLVGDIWVDSTFGCCEESCCKHSCTSFCLNASFQFFAVNSYLWNCWAITSLFTLWLTFWGIAELFSTVAETFYILTSNFWSFSTSSLTFAVFFISFDCVMVLICFPKWLMTLSVFSWAYRSPCTFFGEMSVHVFHLFLNWVVCLKWSYKSSLHVQDSRSFSDKQFADILSHSVGCLFTLLIVFFDAQKVLIWTPVYLFFLLWIMLLVPYLRNYCQI